MKKIFILITIALIMLSCSKNVQVYDTRTTNTTLEKDYWVFENDSIKLTYDFWRERGIMSFSLYNKGDKPIYVDWKNSSFIHNSNKLNYWVDEEFSSLESYYSGYYYKGPLLKPGYTVNAGVQNTSSKTIKPERVTFIPPKSYYYRSQFYLMPIDNYKVNRQIATVKTPEGMKPSENNSYYEEIFENQNSPVKFRNYLALSFSENTQTYFFVDNEFYVSSIKEMKKKMFLGQGTKKPNEDKTTYVYPFRLSTSFYITTIPEGY